ncbi:MAG TPA: CopG family transcriptional regulator [Demequinaceae bacterium]
MAMTLRTDSAVEAALARLAERQGVSKHEAAMRAILRDDAEHQLEDDTMAAYDRVSGEYREALDRLGSV